MKKIQRIAAFTFALFVIAAGGKAFAAEGGGVDSGSVGPFNPDATPPMQEELACNFSFIVGKRMNAIDGNMFGNRHLRIVHRGDPVTEDYSPTRVTIVLDDNDLIAQVMCG